jgi:hypothetical protein
MTHIPRIKSVTLSRCGWVILALALVGCNRDKIKVQEVPKDSDQNAQASGDTAVNPHAGMDMGMGMDAAAGQPQLKWTLPAGWKEKPLSQMRVGSFDAPGKDGQTADVSIIPLATGGPEMELGNVNMWRAALQLPPADKAESEPVPVGPRQGKLYDIDGKGAGRILVATLDHDGMTWYFKMRGDDAVVREQKPVFLDFVKSVSFQSAPATAMAGADPHAAMMEPSAATVPAAAGTPVPAGWKELPPSQFLLAKYLIQGADGAQADVNISMMGGTGGGLVANVTRWRGQLGLPPLSEEDFSKQAQSVETPWGKGTLIDMTGTDAKTGKKARLIGVIAPDGDNTWFYKLMGDEQVVEQQKDAFTKFIQSAKFSHAP